uniref:Uncharacterized protein n=1 Tax=Setaria italica TaxID=4555 RepID=K3ZKQ4_SETIT
MKLEMMDRSWKRRLEWHKLTLYSQLLQRNQEQNLPPLNLVFLSFSQASLGQAPNGRLAGEEDARPTALSGRILCWRAT